MCAGLCGCGCNFEFCGRFPAVSWNKPSGRISARLWTQRSCGSFGRNLRRGMPVARVLFSGKPFVEIGLPWFDGLHCFRLEPKRAAKGWSVCAAQYVPWRNCRGYGTQKYSPVDSGGSAHVAALQNQFSWQCRNQRIHKGPTLLGGSPNAPDRPAGYRKYTA